MGVNPKTFHNFASAFSLSFVVIGLFIIVPMLMLSQGPWTAKDFVELFLFGGSYVIGLLIGVKWPLTGGLLSLILPIFSGVYTIFELVKESHGDALTNSFVSSFIIYLILMIPGLLLLLSWYVQRREVKNETMGKDGPE